MYKRENVLMEKYLKEEMSSGGNVYKGKCIKREM